MALRENPNSMPEPFAAWINELARTDSSVKNFFDRVPRTRMPHRESGLPPADELKRQKTEAVSSFMASHFSEFPMSDDIQQDAVRFHDDFNAYAHDSIEGSNLSIRYGDIIEYTTNHIRSARVKFAHPLSAEEKVQMIDAISEWNNKLGIIHHAQSMDTLRRNLQ